MQMGRQAFAPTALRPDWCSAIAFSNGSTRLPGSTPRLHALGDLATPADLGEGIAFLLEPQSDAVTGETLRVAAGVR